MTWILPTLGASGHAGRCQNVQSLLDYIGSHENRSRPSDKVSL